MPITRDNLKRYEDIEKELGGGVLLPQGTYLFRILQGEVDNSTGMPYVRLPFEIQHPKELEGRQHRGEFLRWFAPEVSETSNKTHEERERGTRGVTYGFIDSLLKSLEDSPTSTDEVAQTVIDARRLMWKDDSQAGDALQIIADTLAGQEFFAKVTHKENKVTGRVDDKLQPIPYAKGVKSLPSTMKV